MLTLLLTNPGERVMLPNYGTPLKRLIFEQNDEASSFTAKDMIAQSIALWEPRVAITNITVSNQVDTTSLNIDDDLSAAGHILFIRIEFVDPENIKEVQELVLNVPLSS